MKTRRTLTAGAFLVTSGFLCTVMSFGAQSQTHHRTTGSMNRIRIGCPNVRQREPVLIYDKSGSTLIGEGVHVQLSVYSDGLATYSQFDASNPTGTAIVRTLSVEAVHALVAELAEAGAETGCDEPMVISDAPLTTVTVFGAPGTDTAAHTFSYYDVSSGVFAEVESALQSFIVTQIDGA